ncbi:hypothetical protein MXF29_21630 [Pseudomonas sp. NC26]|uniref:hypothetical protein n=1 Tax=Pseudomonas TaxID=286 RepID=UPI002181EF64|nr:MULTISPECIES: hypothetical protein [Pseudomonas]MEC4878201.1 hypothetical protein [Pseudomonas sp. NC26]
MADRKHENDQQPSQVDSPAEMTVDPTPQRREEDENPKVFQHLIQRQITPAPITGNRVQRRNKSKHDQE